ncbi:MAG: DUF2203 family protein [Candidatus Zixiibacteriota bacterium]|nr:MAG: DUF2203 family protein [candidate division Zixibacteria bacterium]
MSRKPRKYFTLEEANRTLPLVRSIVRDIVTLFRDVHERRERLAQVRQRHGSGDRYQNNPYSEELQNIEQELDRDIERLNEYADELHRLGVELKDPLLGLVDFYSRMDDRDVYLCWKLGEDEIAYWHELDAGFSGRQSLLESSFTGKNAGGGGGETTPDGT